MTKKHLFFLLIICLTVSAIYSAEYKIMFYNLHNFYDTKDQPEIHDTVLSNKKYQRKKQVLAEPVKTVSPDVLGVCEVESRDILIDWADHHLKEQKFQTIILEVPSDNNYRGIHCGLLSRYPLSKRKNNPTTIAPYSYGVHILKVTLDIAGSELICYVNHWKSRLGGVKETAWKRGKAASALRKDIDKELKLNPQAEILIMGDFNELSDDEHMDDSLENKLGITLNHKNISNRSLYDCWGDMKIEDRSSYILFGNRPQAIDHFIIAPGLIDDKGITYKQKSMQILTQSPFGRKKKEIKIPNRKYSDHFAITCILEKDTP